MANRQEDELLDELISSLESTDPANYSPTQVDENRTLNNSHPPTHPEPNGALLKTKSSQGASSERTDCVDIDMIHIMAEAEEEHLRAKFLEWSLGLDTARMVDQCITDRNLDKLEQMADEIKAGTATPGVLQDRQGEEDFSLTKPP